MDTIIKKYSVKTNNSNITFILNNYKPKGIQLCNLNLLSNHNKKYYWFICKKTDIIYFIHLSTKKLKSKINDNCIARQLYKLNRYTYKHIIINMTKSKIKNILSYDLTINNLSLKRKNILSHFVLKKSNTNNKPIAASSIRNYMLDDPLLDFLNICNKPTFNNNTKDIFLQHILQAGIDFENELVSIIKQKHIVNTVIDNIKLLNKDNYDKYSDLTIEYMKSGSPIIYQAFLYNKKNNTYGLPDLLVRSDYVNILMESNIIDKKEEKISSPKLKIKYHYKIVDIKHSLIHLTSNGLNISNLGSVPAYKGQLYIYLDILNNILGININKAYIWGKKYTFTQKGIKYNIDNFLNKLGIIDYDNFDKKYIDKVSDAIAWKNTINNSGNTLSLLPLPSRKELFPNMKNEKDGYHRHTKSIINNSIKEITDVWYCGINRRHKAHENLIFSWDDKRCNSHNMGFSKGKISNIIDKILTINRQNKNIISPLKVLYERDIWAKKDKDNMIFYLDFETLNSNFGSIIKDGVIYYDENQYIFLIGVGYVHNGKWIFKEFLMKTKSHDAELDMYNEFYNYINMLLNQHNKKIAQFYHWSCAEITSYNQFKNRHNLKIDDSMFKFYDLNKVFINEPIVIKGGLNFSLKTIAKVMYKYKFIKSNWDVNNVCSNGLAALILANKLYESSQDIYIEPIMKSIISYNEIDCKVMWEIHDYMIKNL